MRVREAVVEETYGEERVEVLAQYADEALFGLVTKSMAQGFS